MTGIKRCPFCDCPPVTYFTSYGTIKGHPVLSAYIECKNCDVVMYRPVQHDETSGVTSFNDMENSLENMIWKWNERGKG